MSNENRSSFIRLYKKPLSPIEPWHSIFVIFPSEFYKRQNEANLILPDTFEKLKPSKAWENSNTIWKWFNSLLIEKVKLFKWVVRIEKPKEKIFNRIVTMIAPVVTWFVNGYKYLTVIKYDCMVLIGRNSCPISCKDETTVSWLIDHI